MKEFLVFLGGFCLVLPAGLALARILDPYRTTGKNRRRIREMAAPGPASRKNRAPSFAGKTGIGANRPFLVRLDYLLLSANIPVSAAVFTRIPLAAGGLMALAAGAMTRTLVLPLGIVFLALALPAGYLIFKKKQMERQIIREIPEAVGMIVRALQIGRHVDGALKDAARVLSGPLSMEIRIIYQEMAMGFSFDQAFRDFENRYRNLPDIKLFCTAFIIQRETGGYLVQVLESLADTIRKRFVFQRKLRTYTAEARLSALIIALLPLMFCLVAWIFNPDYIQRLTDTPLGRIMIYTALGLDILGFLVMRKMAGLKG